jgi:hypothetical protein
MQSRCHSPRAPSLARWMVSRALLLVRQRPGQLVPPASLAMLVILGRVPLLSLLEQGPQHPRRVVRRRAAQFALVRGTERRQVHRLPNQVPHEPHQVVRGKRLGHGGRHGRRSSWSGFHPRNASAMAEPAHWRPRSRGSRAGGQRDRLLAGRHSRILPPCVRLAGCSAGVCRAAPRVADHATARTAARGRRPSDPMACARVRILPPCVGIQAIVNSSHTRSFDIKPPPQNLWLADAGLRALIPRNLGSRGHLTATQSQPHFVCASPAPPLGGPHPVGGPPRGSSGASVPATHPRILRETRTFNPPHPSRGPPARVLACPPWVSSTS